MFNPSQYPFTLDRFFELCRESVLYFPNTSTIKLNTFASLNSVDDLNKPNLGVDLKRAKKRYFLSKRYEKKKTAVVEWDFPLIVAINQSGQISEQFKPNNQSRKLFRAVELSVFDTYKDSKNVSGNNADRELEEVQRDCELILLNFLAYFDKVRFVKITSPGSVITYGYHNTDLLDKQIIATTITSYQTDGLVSKVNHWFRSMIEENNLTDLILQPPISESNVAGCSTIIKFKEAQCINPSFNFDFNSNDYIQG